MFWSCFIGVNAIFCHDEVWLYNYIDLIALHRFMQEPRFCDDSFQTVPCCNKVFGDTRLTIISLCNAICRLHEHVLKFIRPSKVEDVYSCIASWGQFVSQSSDKTDRNLPTITLCNKLLQYNTIHYCLIWGHHMNRFC